MKENTKNNNLNKSVVLLRSNNTNLQINTYKLSKKVKTASLEMIKKWLIRNETIEYLYCITNGIFVYLIKMIVK